MNKGFRCKKPSKIEGRAGSYGQKTSTPRENDLRSLAIVVVDDPAQHRFALAT